MSKTLVAVYGSLRKGMGNHSLLKNSEFIAEDSTSGYTMYSLGGFPCLKKSDNKSDIKIELYSVDDNTFSRLDSLEGYPSFYNREKIKTNHGECWIYFIDNDNYRTNDVVESGDWVKFCKERYEQSKNLLDIKDS